MESSWRNTDRRLENKVRFCVHYGNKLCTDCKTTAFHQIESDLTCYISEDSTKMIADIGCPNTVISEEDERFLFMEMILPPSGMKNMMILLNSMKYCGMCSCVKMIQMNCQIQKRKRF